MPGNPVASLINVKGKLYGTTDNGGDGNSGTVFRIGISAAKPRSAIANHGTR